jgi:hypothetical protein
MITADAPDYSASTIFCDDIRHEIGGKTSCIGIYSGTMYVHSAFPIVLPKFCMSVTYVQRSKIFLDEPIKIKIFLPGDEDDTPSIEAEIPLPPEAKQSADKAVLEAAPGTQPATVVHGEFVLSPFTISKPGPIKVRVVRDEKLIRAGALTVKPAEPMALPPPAAETPPS